MQYLQDLTKQIIEKELDNIDEILKLRQDLAKIYKPKKLPSIIQILLASGENRKKLINVLKSKPNRSKLGVFPVAVMARPDPCPHGACVFCPNYIKEGVAMSYTGKEPASMRAVRNKHHPYLQIFNRLQQYLLLGTVPNKIELIIMGGTFPAQDPEYQDDFVRLCYQAMNDFSSLFISPFDYEKFIEFFELDYNDLMNEEKFARIQKKILTSINDKSMEEVKKENENSNIKIVALVQETKPDWCKESHINKMLTHGCTRVELGIQTLNDSVLTKTHRGHDLKDSVEATRLLKDSGYKVGYHFMLGLPGNTKDDDLKYFKELFDNPDYKPDAVKIYPCMVFKNTPLHKMYEKGLFNPMNTKEASSLIAEMKSLIPRYCRVMRVQRDIPTYRREAGVDKTNLRQDIHEVMRIKGLKCQCIRCRQVKDKIIGNVKLNKMEYESSNGKEIFLSLDDEKDQLVGFLRLRIPNSSFRQEINDKTAIIRELHVYGETANFGDKTVTQHLGYGKKLVEEAERITKEFGKNKIVVISGVGVKSYYRNLGYKDDGPYVSKIF